MPLLVWVTQERELGCPRRGPRRLVAVQEIVDRRIAAPAAAAEQSRRLRGCRRVRRLLAVPRYRGAATQPETSAINPVADARGASVDRVIAASCSGERASARRPVLIWNRLWGFQKTRYRGLAKNTTGVHISVALANLFMVRKELLLQGRNVLR